MKRRAESPSFPPRPDAIHRPEPTPWRLHRHRPEARSRHARTRRAELRRVPFQPAQRQSLYHPRAMPEARANQRFQRLDASNAPSHRLEGIREQRFGLWRSARFHPLFDPPARPLRAQPPGDGRIPSLGSFPRMRLRLALASSLRREATSQPPHERRRPQDRPAREAAHSAARHPRRDAAFLKDKRRYQIPNTAVRNLAMLRGPVLAIRNITRPNRPDPAFVQKNTRDFDAVLDLVTRK